MHATHALPARSTTRASPAFGERGLAELMAVIGYYTLVSMTLNAFEVQVGPGKHRCSSAAPDAHGVSSPSWGG